MSIMYSKRRQCAHRQQALRGAALACTPSSRGLKDTGPPAARHVHVSGATCAPISRVEDQKFTGAVWTCSHQGGSGANGASECVRDRGARARLNAAGEGVRDRGSCASDIWGVGRRAEAGIGKKDGAWGVWHMYREGREWRKGRRAERGVLARREGRGKACSIAKPIHESPSSSPWLWPSGCGSTERLGSFRKEATRCSDALNESWLISWYS